jgi:hypothetical protein
MRTGAENSPRPGGSNGAVHYTIELLPGYLKAEMVERDSAAETADFVRAVVDGMRAHERYRILISIRKSRPVFKVEQWKLSETLELLMSEPHVQVAFIADTPELKMSQDYIALLGRQRGLEFETFATEQAAVAWLTRA